MYKSAFISDSDHLYPLMFTASTLFYYPGNTEQFKTWLELCQKQKQTYFRFVIYKNTLIFSFQNVQLPLAFGAF